MTANGEGGEGKQSSQLNSDSCHLECESLYIKILVSPNPSWDMAAYIRDLKDWTSPRERVEGEARGRERWIPRICAWGS